MSKENDEKKVNNAPDFFPENSVDTPEISADDVSDAAPAVPSDAATDAAPAAENSTDAATVSDSDETDNAAESDESGDKKRKKICPAACKVIYAACGLAALLHLAFFLSADFADFFNRYISSVFRAFFAHATGLIPFSLAESVLVSLPVVFILLIIFCITDVSNDTVRMKRYICIMLSVAAGLYSVFVVNFGAGYRTHTLDEKLGLSDSAVSAEELSQTAEIVANELAELIDSTTFSITGSSVMPYSLSEMTEKLNDAYAVFQEKNPALVPKLRAKIKLIALSEPMTYTHISGVYSYYTGEANINTNFPDYTLPYTAAHEMSHQRGIAREDEANFMAFLVCRESDDAYIRYSAYMNMLEYLLSALSSADYSEFLRIYYSLDLRVTGEMTAYSEFFDKYRESAASDVSSAINDTYLKIQGQSEGEKSYGMVVDLAVAYYADNSAK